MTFSCWNFTSQLGSAVNFQDHDQFIYLYTHPHIFKWNIFSVTPSACASVYKYIFIYLFLYKKIFYFGTVSSCTRPERDRPPGFCSSIHSISRIVKSIFYDWTPNWVSVFHTFVWKIPFSWARLNSGVFLLSVNVQLVNHSTCCRRPARSYFQLMRPAGGKI